MMFGGCVGAAANNEHGRSNSRSRRMGVGETVRAECGVADGSASFRRSGGKFEDRAWRVICRTGRLRGGTR